MLVNANALAAERCGRENIVIPGDIGLLGLRTHWPMRPGFACKETGGVKLTFCHLNLLTSYAFFIRLEDFAGALVELDPVSVRWNMAAGDHDGGDAPGETVKGDRGRRDPATIHRSIMHILNRAANGGHDPLSAGSEIPCHGDLAARTAQVANGLQVLNETLGVEIADAICHLDREPASAAGSELDTTGVHQLLHFDFHNSIPIGVKPGGIAAVARLQRLHIRVYGLA
jgi:hypothetical protein